MAAERVAVSLDIKVDRMMTHLQRIQAAALSYSRNLAAIKESPLYGVQTGARPAPPALWEGDDA